MIGIVKGTGSYIPKRCVSNEELSQMVDTNDTWIQERTGVKNRHVIEDETTVSMAVKAAESAIASAGIEARDLDMIIVATLSSNVVMPSTACMVQEQIGAINATCFDLNAACSGFLFAYNTAQSYIATGMGSTILIIGAESLSNIVDWSDRGTCILFGDGAGAVVVQASEGAFYPPVMHANGAKGSALTCDTVHSRKTLLNKESDSISDITNTGYMYMNGQEVFKFAVRQVPTCIEELLGRINIDKDEIDYFILHQANRRIVESVAKRLKVDISKFPMNLMEYGNTSSASIPILLDELNRDEVLKPGMKLVMSGFGAGLTWGATYLEWK
ncbi:MAG: beta-ketoacyl-ACP synthase III [Eubacteriales bacterium]